MPILFRYELIYTFEYRFPQIFELQPYYNYKFTLITYKKEVYILYYFKPKKLNNYYNGIF